MTKGLLLEQIHKTFYNSIGKLDKHLQNPNSKSYNKELLEELKMQTSHIPDTTIKEQIYILENNLKERPKCYCGNDNIFKGKEYTKYCSSICQRKSPERKAKVKENWKNKSKEELKEYSDKNKQTKLERYGDENYNNSSKISKTLLSKTDKEWEEINQKAKQTKLERYGDEKYCNSDKISETWANFTEEQRETIQAKKIETYLDKYGVSHPFKLEEMRNRRIETMKEKYGVSHPMYLQKIKDKIQQRKEENNTLQNNPELISKAKETNLEKYNAITFTSSPEGKAQVKATKLERYGDENYCNGNKISESLLNKSPEEWNEINKQRKETNIKIYGTKTFAESYISKSNIYKNHFLIYKDRYKEDNVSILTTEEDYLKNRFDKSNTVNLKCNTCGIEWNSYLSYNGNISKCRKCFPYSHRTDFNIMNDILEFNEFKYQDRTKIKPYELDIYVDSYNFAIEYDGLMYHSFGTSEHTKFNTAIFEHENKNNHLMKTNRCQEIGIHLFHIFENEWLDLNKKEIWQSMIKSKLGRNERIFARKCKIKEITSSESKQFLIENHLQGNVNASINIGLFYNDILVSLMTFGKSRFDKNIEYELLRFANKKNHNIIGGASKLLKYFERTYHPKSLISYANKRWSQGKVYDILEFKYIETTNPNYFYVKDGLVFSRQTFQKHKLKDILEVYDENLTETDNMYNNNYRKIYDCGNLKYIKEYK